MKPSPPLIIEDWQKAIAPSPHIGFADMRNIDVFSKPGIVQLNFALQAMTSTTVIRTFTADASSDVLTIPTGSFEFHGHSGTMRAVRVSTTGTLPGGLTAGTIYFLVELTATTYKLATTLDNASNGTPTIDITDAGSGTHTITSVEMARPKFVAHEERTDTYYLQDADARIWESRGGIEWYLIVGNSLEMSFAHGLVIWKNYLLAFRSARVDVYGPFTAARSARTWTNDWQTLNAGLGDFNDHVALVGQDDVVYFADRNTTNGTPYVGSIHQQPDTTFDPADSTTYSFDNQALDLPSYKTITCLSEQGLKLMIGTVGKEIYPWDRTSDSFDLPIIAAEKGISQMITSNNVVFFFAGTRGNLYATLGTTASLMFEFPVGISNIPTNPITITGMAAHKGRILFGVQCVGASGVWAYDPTLKSLTLTNRISRGTYGTTQGHAIGPIISVSSDNYFVGWWDVDNTVYGMDAQYINNYARETGYSGYLESALYRVGTRLIPRTYNTIEIETAKPLVSGQGVRVSFRLNLTDTYREICTFDFATHGGDGSYTVDAPITDAEFVQIKAELTTADSVTTTPELARIVLK